jgi:hypothetical protein
MILAACLCMPCRAAGTEITDTGGEDGARAESCVPEGSCTREVPAQREETTVDSVHDIMSNGVTEAATWFDSFFSSPEEQAETNRSYLRLSFGVLKEESEKIDTDLKLNGKIHLPHIQKHLNLTFSGNSDEDQDEDQDEELGDLDPGDSRDNDEYTLGLQYFVKQTTKQSLSANTGVRFRNGFPSVFIGPRYRLYVGLDHWKMRFTQRLLWDTDSGWEALTRFDFDRKILDRFLFRITPRGKWEQDEKGYDYDLQFRLYQRLGVASAVIYEQNNDFETHPHNRLEKFDLQVRYRRQALRKWLFFEVAPRVTFRKDNNFDAQLGLQLRLEVAFGNVGYWSRSGTLLRSVPKQVPDEPESDRSP